MVLSHDVPLLSDSQDDILFWTCRHFFSLNNLGKREKAHLRNIHHLILISNKSPHLSLKLRTWCPIGSTLILSFFKILGWILHQLKYLIPQNMLINCPPPVQLCPEVSETCKCFKYSILWKCAPLGRVDLLHIYIYIVCAPVEFIAFHSGKLAWSYQLCNKDHAFGSYHFCYYNCWSGSCQYTCSCQ